MSTHLSVPHKSLLPFAPENIFPMEDGTFVWFDGHEHHDVTHHPVWWKCPYGHEWQESLVSMTARGAGAPCCTACETS